MAARRLAVTLSVVPVAVAAGFAGGGASASQPHVLRVGSWNGMAGTFSTIQAAVSAAQPGDWVLVGPGDYHEQGKPGDLDQRAGVLISTPGIHLRGMDRNRVIVDGTKASAPRPCDAAPSSQDFGAPDGAGGVEGRNGVDVAWVDGVSIENMVVCNFLSSSEGERGNQIWWNGGDGSGHIGLHSLHGAYLTASSSYNYGTDPANNGSNTVPMGQYGIFTSNESGPGTITNSYASNMGDSAYYIGACPDCNMVLTDSHAENSALGFSGTNAGGHLVIENSEWDQNKAGIVPNTLNNDDWPSPANGACPSGVGSCSIIRGNYVHDNNNQNAPSFGIAGAAPPGTGILLSGIRNFTVTGNTIVDNNSWGVVVNDFPDTETPPAGAPSCAGGTDLSTPLQDLCYYPAFGNEVAGNSFTNNGNGWNGSGGNPGNADIAVASLPSAPNNGNCFHGNTDTGGTLSSDPPAIQTVMGVCGVPNSGWVGPSFVQLVCSTPGALDLGGFSPSCNIPVVASYPQVTGIVMLPIPFDQPTIPNPCAGVPVNPWCPTTSGGAVLPASSPGGGSLWAMAFPVAIGGFALRRRLRGSAR